VVANPERDQHHLLVELTVPRGVWSHDRSELLAIQDGVEHMDAVIATGGKQYRVSPGQIISVEKVPGDKGSPVEFTDVLLVNRDGEVLVGAPGLPGARVRAEVVRQARRRKVMVVKFKRRKNYRRHHGHRQHVTMVRITGIEV